MVDFLSHHRLTNCTMLVASGIGVSEECMLSQQSHSCIIFVKYQLVTKSHP